jgi:hypothetical protein
MTYKCPRCSFKGTYKQVQRHFYSKHHTPKGASVSKSKQKKVYTFKPTNFGRK